MSSSAPPDPVLAPDPVPAPEVLAPEVLAFGPSPAGRARRRALTVAAVVVAVLLAGVAVWRLLPEPPPPFSLVDLQGVYAGMVRSDGTNEVSILTPDKLTEPPSRVSPPECVPLFDATLSNQFPAAALDGVSTYWLDAGGATISLATYRFGDAKAARRQFDEVAAAVPACTHRPLTLGKSSTMTVGPQPVTEPADVDGYLSYLQSASGADSRFSTDVALLDNTVTWQYRYDYRSQDNYTPLPAQQLMSSLMSQMHDVQDRNR